MALAGVFLLAAVTAVVLAFFPPRLAGAVWIALRSAVLALLALGLVRSDRPRRAASRPRGVVASFAVVLVVGGLVAAGYGEGADTAFYDAAAALVAFLWVPIAAYAIYRLPRRREDVGGPAVLLDAVVAGSALSFIGWLAVLRPLVDSAGVSFVVASHCLFVVGDATVIAMAVALLPHAALFSRRSLVYFVGGMTAVAMSDCVAALEWTRRSGAEWSWTQLAGDLLLLAVAAGALGGNRSRRGILGGLGGRYLAQLPLAAVVVVGVGYLATGRSLTIDEAFPAVLMLSALLARQLLYTRELAKGEIASMSDPLTGLASRRAFLERVESHLGAAQDVPVAVAVVNVNGFREINDGFGHDMGDAVLKNFSSHLSRVAGRHLVARLGADEFAVLIVGNEETSEAAAKLSRTCVVDLPGGGAVPVDPRVGVALAQAGDSASDLLSRADLAMQSTRSGQQRRRYAFFHPTLQLGASRRHRMAASMAGAGERGELRAVFQPLFHMGSGKVAGAEALLRWRHPDFGEVLPSEFIPIAEETGHIEELGEWILAEALGEAARWRDRGRHFETLLVNASVRQLSPTFPIRVAEALSVAGLSAQLLTIEVTETLFADPQVVTVLKALRELGVRLAMDDFGAGYSSLAQLIHLPVDVVKLDKELTAGVDSKGGSDVLRTVVSLAETLGLCTVAEGIETERHYRAALSARATFGQGHHLSPPVESRRLEGLLPLRRERNQGALACGGALRPGDFVATETVSEP